VTANGTSPFVEKLTKFAPEMQVHYAHFSVSGGCTATISVTVNTSFSSYTVSPKSRNISATTSGQTITFSSGPNYLILQFDSNELLFILIDSEESNPPHLGDSDVKNIADYAVDTMGATLMTSKIQSAINAASGATRNVLYFPPGKYLVGELWLKSNMTMYLAGGAVLYGSSNPADFNTGTGGLTVEQASHGLIHMLNVSNTKILGRGVIDGNGVVLRTAVGAGGAGATGATGAALLNLVKIDQSSNILIDGIVTRDSSFWNTLIYKSDKVTIQNYKVMNQRPITTTFNQTDGVDFDASTNGHLQNAFLYTGDDNMATKTELTANMNTNGIVHEHVVTYSNSGGCKIGTKTGGTVMDGIVFRDIDVVKAGRAMAIDGYDTAVIQNTVYENIRVEAADTLLIDIEEDNPPTWRTAANTTITKNTSYTNVTSAVDKTVNLHGKSSTIDVDGVHFSGLTVLGMPVTSPGAAWSTMNAINITFQ
jgi:Glycosyl hydrolases family 28